MAHNADKEAWITRVMAGAGNIPQANVHADIYERVMEGVNKPPVKIFVLPVKQWAAAAILLLALNIGSVIYVASQSKAAHTDTSAALAPELQLTATYNY